MADKTDKVKVGYKVDGQAAANAVLFADVMAD